MTLHNKPVGWWCKVCNNMQTDNDGYCQTFDCDGGNKLEPVYARTQVRNEFEGLIEYLRKEAQVLESEGSMKMASGLFHASSETRRRMEEW